MQNTKLVYFETKEVLQKIVDSMIQDGNEIVTIVCTSLPKDDMNNVYRADYLIVYI